MQKKQRTVNRQQQQTGRRTQRKRKQHKLRRIFLRTLCITFGVLLLAVGGAFAAFKYYTKDMKRETVAEENLNVNTEQQQQSTEMKIKNIALFGVNGTGDNDTGNSDAILIASIDGNRGKVKLISIARDTYVNLPEKGHTKINHAYSYGGPELAMATLNENFGLDITDYVTVNFDQLADIVDELGGIDLEVSEAERQQINAYLEPGVERLQESGFVHLNGGQAVSYSRIRKIDSDTMRGSRQRKVLECLFEKRNEISALEYPSYIKKMMPMVETSMTDTELLQLVPIALEKDLVMEQDGFPNDYIVADGGSIVTEVEGVPLWVYQYDLEQATEMIYQFIYEDVSFAEQYGDVEEASVE